MFFGLPVSPITSLAATGNTLWIGTSAGLSRHQRGTRTAERVAGLSSDHIVTLAADGADALLVGTATGLNRIAGGRVEIITGLPADQVTAVRRDRDGNLWIGTYSHGLFGHGGGRIAAYGLADGLLNPTVRAIFEDDEEHLDRLDDLGRGYAMAVAETHDGQMWFATGAGLAEFDGTAFKLRSAPRGLPSNRLFGIEADADDEGTVWMVTDGDGMIRDRTRRVGTRRYVCLLERPRPGRDDEIGAQPDEFVAAASRAYWRRLGGDFARRRVVGRPAGPGQISWANEVHRESFAGQAVSQAALVPVQPDSEGRRRSTISIDPA